jgi:hypothetical protein
LSSVSRLWDGDYVRIRGFRRELSYWCSQAFVTAANIKPNTNQWVLNGKNKEFIKEAESIIKSNNSETEKANALVILEAVRALSKTTSPAQLGILGARLDQLIL